MDTEYTFPKLTQTNLFETLFGTKGVPLNTELVLKQETKNVLLAVGGLFAFGLIIAAVVIKSK
jgi:hypothetical protein